MTQAIRTFITDTTPVEAAIATQGATVYAVARHVPHEDDLEAPADGWVIVERDIARNLLRETTKVYGSRAQAQEAFWSEPWPLEFEAWVSPLFTTSEIAEAA